MRNKTIDKFVQHGVRTLPRWTQGYTRRLSRVPLQRQNLSNIHTTSLFATIATPRPAEPATLTKTELRKMENALADFALSPINHLRLAQQIPNLPTPTTFTFNSGERFFSSLKIDN